MKSLADRTREIVENPLQLLPREWQGWTWKFWAHWSSILPNQLALSMRLHEWQRHGLTTDDVKRIFAHLLTPEAAASIQFPGQLMAELGKIVAIFIERRRMAQVAERRRAEAEESKHRSTTNPPAKSLTEAFAERFLDASAK